VCVASCKFFLTELPGGVRLQDVDPRKEIETRELVIRERQKGVLFIARKFINWLGGGGSRLRFLPVTTLHGHGNIGSQFPGHGVRVVNLGKK